jgi:hypothetical protein
MMLPIEADGSEARHSVVIEIGGLPIEVQTDEAEFAHLLRLRYADYARDGGKPEFALRVQLMAPEKFDADADVEVRFEGREWRLRRGDFDARWNPSERQGRVLQSANPYSIDSVLRIMHSLMLAPEGGFLVHASSAVRNGKAYLFSGVSEAGKTTMARLAPEDVVLLTDEASYVRRVSGGYLAYGTPFAGELGVPGRNISAPIAAVYLLEKGPVNRVDEIGPAMAVKRLLRNILFFAHQPELVRQVFEAACAFVATVPVYQLTFFPDERIWGLIG